MPDYEIFAPNDAVMQSALQSLGCKVGSGKSGVTVYAVDYYGTKYLQSGTIAAAPYADRPNMVAQSGVYANIRWMGASVLTLPANVTSLGATLKLQASPYYRVWAA